MKEDEPMIIHGMVHEFANGFTIELTNGAKNSSLDLSPKIYHGSPNFPYERVHELLHLEADIWVTTNQGIVNIEPIKPLRDNGTSLDPKSLLQRFLQLLSR